MSGSFDLVSNGQSSFVPIIIKPNEATNVRASPGMNVAIDPPAITPIREASTKAEEDPINTAKGLSDVPLIATVAN